MPRRSLRLTSPCARNEQRPAYRTLAAGEMGNVQTSGSYQKAPMPAAFCGRFPRASTRRTTSGRSSAALTGTLSVVATLPSRTIFADRRVSHTGCGGLHPGGASPNAPAATSSVPGVGFRPGCLHPGGFGIPAQVGFVRTKTARHDDRRLSDNSTGGFFVFRTYIVPGFHLGPPLQDGADRLADGWGVDLVVRGQAEG